MEFIELKCTYCGSNMENAGGDAGVVKCRFCGTSMLTDSAKRLAEKYREMLRTGDEIDLGRCRNALRDMVNDRGVEEAVALQYIQKILTLVPDDFEAGYYKAFYQRRRDPHGYAHYLESKRTGPMSSK